MQNAPCSRAPSFRWLDLRLRITTMKNLNSYIDHCIIEEYADRNLKNGYSLDVDDLPKHDFDNFLNMLMEEDTSVRDYVRCSMQKMIDARLPEVESKARYWRMQA